MNCRSSGHIRRNRPLTLISTLILMSGGASWEASSAGDVNSSAVPMFRLSFGSMASASTEAAPAADASQTTKASTDHAAQSADAHGAASEGEAAKGEAASSTHSAGDSSGSPALPGALPGAVERLLVLSDRAGQPSLPEPAPVELYAAWNAGLRKPMEPSLLLLGASSGAASPWWKSLWFGLGAGLLVGAAGTYFVTRRLAQRRAAEEGALGEWTGAQGSGIELVTAQNLNDDGSVLVVDVCGEQLVLGISGSRDYVTLLTKLGSPADADHLDPAHLEALMASHVARQAQPGQMPPGASSSGRGMAGSRSGSGRASYGTGTGGTHAGGSHASPYAQDNVHSGGAVSASSSASNLMSPPMEEEHSSDADLEELLDELLGKVRGLKPLAKHTDDT